MPRFNVTFKQKKKKRSTDRMNVFNGPTLWVLWKENKILHLLRY